MNEKAEILGEILKDYSVRTDSRKLSEGQKHLIFSVRRPHLTTGLVGGLADRLKGLISCFYLAVLSDRRFTVDWETPLPLTDCLLPRGHDWRYQSAQKFVRQLSVFRHLDMIDRSDCVDFIDPNDLESSIFKSDDAVVANMNNLRFETIRKFLKDRFDVHMNNELLFNAAFQHLFRFVEHSEFDGSRKQLEDSRSRSDLFIGAHLRTGGGNGWRDPVMDDWRNYQAVVERAVREAEDRNATQPVLYFLSDSDEARQAVAEKEWPCEVIVELNKVSHMDRSDDSSITSNRLTFFEFEQLSKCDFIVCGKGGFSALAAAAGNVPLMRYG